jgi:hypothetical protein
MRSKCIVAVLSILMLVSTGCAYRTVFKAEELTALAAMNNSQSNETVVGHFEESRWNHFFILGFVPTCEPRLKEMLSYVPAGHEVRNLQIMNEESPPNLILRIFSFGIYTPTTTIVSGDVVKVVRESE